MITRKIRGGWALEHMSRRKYCPTEQRVFSVEKLYYDTDTIVGRARIS